MSLEVLTAIWRNPPCKGGELLCLLAIADNADDDGYAWPSVATVAKKAAMQERGAQKCIKRLAEAGLITIKQGGGRNKTNAYQITTNGIGPEADHKNPEQYTPSQRTGFRDENPVQRDINPVPADAKPRPSGHPNSQEPPKEPPSKRKTRIHADAVISQRMIEIAIEEGHCESEARAQFDQFKFGAIANGRTYANWDAAWRNWFRSPYFKTVGGHNGNAVYSRKGNANRPGNRADSALEQLARVAGLGEAQGDGRSRA